MDRKDLFAFFLEIKHYSDIEFTTLFENYEISKLDINRIYRYLDKYTKETDIEEDEVVDDDASV
jgi:hypothetical protein